MADPVVTYTFYPRDVHAQQRSTVTKQGHTIHWQLPSLHVDVRLNGEEVGYVESHMHPAWAGDGIPDVSFGFTGRVNLAELAHSLGYRLVPLEERTT